MRLKCALPVAAALLSALPAASIADTIYGSDGSTLYQINPTNGSMVTSVSLSTDLTGAGASSLDGLASWGGVLYGDLQLNSGGGVQLVTINPTTGSFTDIGSASTGVTGGPLSFSSGGQLYFVGGTAYGVQSVDKTTGALGSTYACGTGGAGFMIGADGEAWVAGGGGVFLTESPLVSGATCSGGSATGSGGVIRAMTAGDGVNLAVYYNGGTSTLNSFATTFPVGGTPILTTLGTLTSNITSLADVGSSPTPEPSSLVLLGAGLAGWGGFWYRRRRRALD